jgi:putative transposase
MTSFPIFRLKEALWHRLKQLIPQHKGSGRKPTQDKGCFEALIYLLKTGVQYANLPKEYPPKSTVHSAYKRWIERGILEKMWRQLLLEYDDTIGLDWQWLSADSSSVKAPLGGDEAGKKSDRPR